MEKWIILAAILGASFHAYCNDMGLAKVVRMRGRAYAYEKHQEPFRLKKGAVLSESTAVQTDKSSFVRIKMSDGSVLNIGPNSKMVINRLPDKSRPGILSLVKGKLRATVQKDKGRDKLFIRTRTASMGVRGTDFMVSYNPERKITNTITYQGEVAMLQTGNLVGKSDLGRALSSEKVVSVKKGQFSFANPRLGRRATIPTKLSPIQFHSLKRNRDFKPSRRGASEVRVKSIIPPGLSGTRVAQESVMVDKISKRVAAPIKSPPPEGLHDRTSGKMAPPAGGYVDMRSGEYISPPPGSSFDPTTGVYVPPADYGSVDPRTGEFKLPPSTTIDKKGQLVNPETDDIKPNNPTLAPNQPRPADGSPELKPLPKEKPVFKPIPIPDIPETVRLPLGKVRFHMTVSDA